MMQDTFCLLHIKHYYESKEKTGFNKINHSSVRRESKRGRKREEESPRIGLRMKIHFF